MRFTTLASAAALAPVLASAASMADLKNNLGTAHVHNKCPYPVYLWSVKKDQGCESGNMKVLKTGESYSEKYRDDYSETGVSIKISKEDKCKGIGKNGKEIDITQLEYHINHDNPDFLYNFLDVSFVDCLTNDCPGRDRFHLKSGNNGDVRLATAGADKAICPVLSCASEEECATMAYILPDDVQTKSCEPAADMDFYICADSADDDSSYEEPAPSSSYEEPAPSSSEVEEEKPEPTSTKEEEKPSVVEAKVNKAAITPAPKEDPIKQKKVKTEVVYVTEYKYVNAKRHAHGYQHKHFQA